MLKIFKFYLGSDFARKFGNELTIFDNFLGASDKLKIVIIFLFNDVIMISL